MSFFSKKKNEEERSYFAFEDTSKEAATLGENRSHNPDVLTPEEILHKKVGEKSSATPSDALENLKNRMKEARQKKTGKFTFEIEEPEQESEAAKAAEQEIAQMILRAEEQASTEPEPPAKTKKPAEPTEKEDTTTLLERCRVYTVDENGEDRAGQDVPVYELESVADILKAQSQNTMDRLSQKYNISFDTLGKVSGEDMKLDPALTEEPETHSEEETPEEEPETPAQDKGEGGHLVISDLDAAPVSAVAEEAATTVRFTPVTGQGQSSKISVSSTTKTVDLTGELADFAVDTPEEAPGELQLERTEFDEYKPEVEYHSKDDGKVIRKLLAKKRRNSFFKMALSVVLTLIPAIFCMPFLSGAVLSDTHHLFTVIALIATGGIAAMQWDMFLSLAKIKSRKVTADIAAVTASLTVLVYAVVGMLTDENVLPVLLMLCIVLMIRSVGCFFRDSVMFSNYRHISAKAPKRAVKLIRDPAVTYAMAKNSIEGDVLIAAPQKTDHVDDFMKYSTFRVFLGGKMPAITVIFALLSLILGLASASYFHGAIYGLYSAAVIQCLFAAPVLFLIEDLPLFSAARHLNRIGSVIAGKTGAEHIAEANAVVLTSAELFPAGTVTLNQMQVLSQNSIDDTIIRAAALTDAMDSPLSSVFKKIAGTGGNVVLPEADTVKYEDKMGISGWVDNRLLFVGNRTLMEAHGIKVPDIETDRKLLRNGYFPVYVSDAEKACALLAVQYRVDETVAREVRRLSSMGITMLIQSSDPNMTEEMICDYIGLYEDSVKVMTSAGCHMYRNTACPAESVSAPAAYKGNPVGLSAIVTAANRICKAFTKLTVLYLITAILGAILFVYMSFDGKGTPAGGEMLLLYEVIGTALSTLIYFFEKP